MKFIIWDTKDEAAVSLPSTSAKLTKLVKSLNRQYNGKDRYFLKEYVQEKKKCL